MDKIDIVIPTYMNENLTVRCINSIIKYTKVNYRIIWIDDGSSNMSYQTVLKYLNRKKLDYISYRYSENGGPARAINQGLKLSESNQIAIINNDIIVTENWLSKLSKAISSSPSIGLIGTVTDHTSSACRYDRATKFLGHEIIGDMEQFFNELPTQIKGVETNIPYHCVVIKKEVIDTAGYLDERFYAGAEDDDYNDRIRLAGFQTAICLNCFIYHDHHATLNLIPNIHKRRRQNVVLLRQKRAQRVQRK